jgi:signal peptidase I
MESSSNIPLVKKIILEIWDIIKFLAPIVIIVFLVRTYIAQPFIVDGESSAPNFHTGHYLIIDEISYRFKDPARADVIVLRYPLQPSRFFLKRVIGLPGERVVIKDGKVFIYNEQNPKGFVLDEPYHKQATFPAGPYRDVTLGADEYFVMGDNRSGSDDSRMWGILPRKDIIGHVLFRLFPIKLAGYTPASSDDFSTNEK